MTTSASAQEGILRVAVRAWDRFWFHPSDPTVLGMVRIFVGLIGLYVHLSYTPDLLDFVGPDGWVDAETMAVFRKEVPSSARPYDWSDDAIQQGPSEDLTRDDLRFIREWDGVNPRRMAVRGYWSWSIYYHVTDARWIYIVHACVVVVFFLLAIGLGTRVASVLAWLATLSYLQRHYVGFFGMDTILSFMTLYLAIGPSGAALSADRLIGRYVRSWRALRARSSARKQGSVPPHDLDVAEGVALDLPKPSVSANLALRLIQVHMCIVYLAAGLSKLMGQAWWNGTALWGTMINPEFCPVYSAPYMAFIHFLCQHRWLWELFTTGGVLFTLAFEISFPFLVWKSATRWMMILGAIVLHAGIAFFMGLTPFSLIMISAVASFTPVSALNRYLQRVTSGPEGFRLSYSRNERGQLRRASLVRAFDPWNQVRLVEREHAEQSAPLELVADNGEVATGYLLYERLTRSLRLLAPLALISFIPGVSALGKALFPARSTAHRTRPAASPETSPRA